MLDPIIHQAERLRILATLFYDRYSIIADLRRQLGLTDGNLASHLQKLELAGYVRRGKSLLPRGFAAHVEITPTGSEAFRRYCDGLRKVLSPPGVENTNLLGPRPEP